MQIYGHSHGKMGWTEERVMSTGLVKERTRERVDRRRKSYGHGHSYRADTGGGGKEKRSY